MDPDTSAALATLISIGLSLLGALLGALILYFIIRQGVFHGMRAHTRWIDHGKDYEKLR
ncbi:hypothetical protein PFZ55_45245 [Streptomyces sp. MS2A]|uniref:hypothetical protein n=1 Tax=Microbacterium resistens TaxID=156977 RepID=UPI000AEAE70F|nr:hypothetical protein [Microbacterium resistens]MDA4894088.1 hypothetical protein [Streptomyces sp. MS2A]